MSPIDDVTQQAVDRAVADLIADHERQGNHLSQDQVERMLDKRKIGGIESLSVYQRLSENGIDIADDGELPPRPGGATGNTLRSAGSGAAIFSDTLAHSILTAAEEVELGRRIELARKLEAELSEDREALLSADADRILQRGADARLKFVLHNIRLVYNIARRYAGIGGLSISDLLQEGIIGLMRAVEMFDHTKGFKFSTYATWWVRQSITRAIADRGSTIRLPVHMVEKITRLNRAERRLAKATGSLPSIQDIADDLDWKPEEVARLQAVSRIGVVSLDVPKDDDKGVGAIMDTMPSEAPGPEEIAIAHDLAARLRAAMESLKPREKIVLMKRFGLDDGNPKTLEQIGEQFGMTRERVRQIEAKALEHLRHPARSRPLRTFVDRR